MTTSVRYWFEQAVGVPACDRLAFLKAGCPDEEVLGEVLSLLEHDVEDEHSSSAALLQLLGSVLSAEALPAERVGPFELGRLLGSGGMGFVYEAHRVDGEVRQRVAVKFAQVSPAASDKFRRTVHRRFLRERQMLASLRHPYIAGLIDAGTTDDGVPYAVIEQVDGEPIDRYCETWLPDRADRIRLVVKLCDAVQFAHRNLIVHSDIKPDNVLVTADGIPKLIDFGVASDISEDASLTTMRAFTPGYASPEQCRGVAPTVATDVYGLGGILYRLLTGAPPHGSASGSISETIRSICDEDVVRPSAIRPELKGDIENILLKALQRQPQKRYGSVPELADDLNRFLECRPVSATPDSAIYRTSRFVRRHWVAVSAVAMLVVSLAGSAVLSIRQKQEAVARAAETRRLADRLLFEVHDDIRGVIGGTRAREKLGDMAAQYLEALQRDPGHDPELAWELLNAWSRLAQSRGGLVSSVGDTTGGSDIAARTLALGAIVEKAGPDARRMDALFTIYEGLVAIFLDAGRRQDGREAVDRMLRLAPHLPRIREAQALKQLARYYDATGSQHESYDAWARALSVLRSISQSPEQPVGTAAQLASTLAGFGRAQALAGSFTESMTTLQEAIQLSGARSAAEPQNTHAARQLYWSYIALGDLLGSPLRFSLGRPLEAVQQYRKARQVAERLATADPGNDMARLDLSRAFSREGTALVAVRPEEALNLLERSYKLATQTSSRNHAGLDARLGWLTTSVEPLVRLRRLDEARTNLSEARRLIVLMRENGVIADERGVLRAEEILLYASGRAREAIAVAQKHLAALPVDTRPVLSDNFPAVELLGRMRMYGEGVDGEGCAAASDRLLRIWNDLQAKYPGSTFVRGQAEKAHALHRKSCS